MFHNQDQKEHIQMCPWVVLFLTQAEPFGDLRGDVCQSRASSGLPISNWSPRAWEQRHDALIQKCAKQSRHEAKRSNITSPFIHI